MGKRTKSKTKPLIVKTPVETLVKVEDKENILGDILKEIEFTKIRNARRELSKKYGKAFDVWYEKYSNTEFAKQTLKEQLEYLQGCRKYLKLKLKPKQIQWLYSPENMSEVLDDIRSPAVGVYDEKIYHLGHLTPAQQYLVAVTTREGEEPKYMGKKLTPPDIHALETFKKHNAGYKEYLQKIARYKRIKEHIDKPFEPVKKLREQYEEIGRRIKNSFYVPEMELLHELKKNLGVDNVESEGSYIADDGKKRTADMTVRIGNDVTHIEANSTGELKAVVGSPEVIARDWDNNYEIPLPIGFGFNSYCVRNKIKNRFDLPEHWLKNNPNKIDYHVKSFNDATALAKNLGLLPYDVFKIICQAIVKARPRLEREARFANGIAIQQLVDYFDNQTEAFKKAGKKKYKLTDLHRSKFFEKWVKDFKLNYYKNYKRLHEEWEGWVRITKAVAIRKQ